MEEAAISQNTAAELVRTLGSLSRLRELNLSRNQLQGSGLELASALSALTGLCNVEICYVEITNIEVQSLIDVAKQMPSLTMIDLVGNRVHSTQEDWIWC